MAQRTVDPIHVPVEITTAANTPIANPQFTALNLNPGRLSNVEVYVPSGHSGQTGVRLEMAQRQILPYSTASMWIKGDDYRHDFGFDLEVGAGLRVVTYNTGLFAHTHYLRLTIWKLVPSRPARSTGPVQLIPVTELSAS